MQRSRHLDFAASAQVEHQLRLVAEPLVAAQVDAVADGDPSQAGIRSLIERLARAEASVARGQATGAALTSAAESVRALAVAVERVPVALDALDDRLDARFERLERALAEIRAHVAPPTGEHRAGGA